MKNEEFWSQKIVREEARKHVFLFLRRNFYKPFDH
jgi:hypothetical protein